MRHLTEMTALLADHGVALVVLKQGIDTTTLETGPDREHAEVSMLALHLLRALVHVNTLLPQAVLEVPAFHDLIGEHEHRRLNPLFWTHINPYGACLGTGRGPPAVE